MTFLTPLYLFGLSLIAVPIIIHLWYQKRLKRIPFSTLKFLKKSEAKRFGWLKFREIVVLLLRCLIIAFVFLSLSRPQLRSKFLGGGRLASVVLVIDNSYSMGYGENFEKAKELGAKLVSMYSTNAEFCILPLCDVREENVYWINARSAQASIEKIKLTHKYGLLNDAILNLPEPKPTHELEYIYIGDGQESNFIDFTKETLNRAKFFWLKIPAGSNIGITKVFMKDPIAVPLDNYTLNVHITNFSSKIWSGAISLNANYYRIDQEHEIKPGETKLTEFLLPVDMRRGTIVVFDDSLLVDNAYYFSKILPYKLNVLIIGQNKFLHQALTLSNKLKAPFSIDTADDLNGIDLRKFNCVILAGLPEISASSVIKLNDFLKQKETAIICFLGSEVGGNLRNFIARCCTVEKEVLPKGYVILDWVDYEHPIFKVFTGTTSLKNIKFYRFQKIIAKKNVVARLSGNYPLIVLDENLAVIAGQFIPQTSDLVYKTAFVPLFFRLIKSLIFKTQDREFYVGDEMSEFESMRGPSGIYLGRGSEFRVPGFYTTDRETVAVNVMPDEGNLKSIGHEMLRILNISILDIEKDLMGSDLSKIFLLLAISAILFEVVLLLIR